MKFEIKNRLTGAVKFTRNAKSFKLFFEAAVEAKVDFRNSLFENVAFEGIYATGLDFTNSTFTNSTFTYSAFTYSKFTDSAFTNSTFTNSTFTDSTFTDSKFTDSAFTNSTFTYSKFTNSKFDGVAVKTIRFFSGLYAYHVWAMIDTKGERWVRMGCLLKSLAEWEKVGIRNSNRSEFPDDGSEKCENRVAAFEFAKAAALRMK